MSTSATEIKSNTATFGAGCYWGTEKYYRVDFQKLHPESIIDVKVGFMGGNVDDPSYRQVCGGNTGHVEVAQIVFDANKASYEDLVKFFFSMHDASTLNRQGNDVGTQYASVIFTHSNEQEQIAKSVRDRLQDIFKATESAGGEALSSNVWKSDKDTITWRGRRRYDNLDVVTSIRPAERFYTAEEAHQLYLEKNPDGYCNHSIRFTWDN